jgi:hypothetical protein
MNALSLHLLAEATVVKNESYKGSQELVRQYMLCVAPRAAVEETCSAIQSSPDGLECLASSAWPMPAAFWPAKIPASRPCASQAKKNMSIRTQEGTPPFSRPLGRMAAHAMRRTLYPCASGHTSRSCGLQPANPKNLRLRHPKETQEKPTETQGKPKKTQEKPTETQEDFANPASCAPSRSGDG